MTLGNHQGYIEDRLCRWLVHARKSSPSVSRFKLGDCHMMLFSADIIAAPIKPAHSVIQRSMKCKAQLALTYGDRVRENKRNQLGSFVVGDFYRLLPFTFANNLGELDFKLVCMQRDKARRLQQGKLYCFLAAKSEFL